MLRTVDTIVGGTFRLLWRIVSWLWQRRLDRRRHRDHAQSQGPGPVTTGRWAAMWRPGWQRPAGAVIALILCAEIRVEPIAAMMFVAGAGLVIWHARLVVVNGIERPSETPAPGALAAADWWAIPMGVLLLIASAISVLHGGLLGLLIVVFLIGLVVDRRLRTWHRRQALRAQAGAEAEIMVAARDALGFPPLHPREVEGGREDLAVRIYQSDEHGPTCAAIAVPEHRILKRGSEPQITRGLPAPWVGGHRYRLRPAPDLARAPSRDRAAAIPRRPRSHEHPRRMCVPARDRPRARGTTAMGGSGTPM